MKPDLPLSVLLLVRDETRDVEALLPSLAFAAEVVVVWDPRGDRATREAAERLGARVFERVFDGFGPQRRFALARCTQPYVLWIDADERLRPGAEEALRAACASGGASFTLLRETRFLGRRIRFCGWQRERIVRVFAREAFGFDDAPVHERLVPAGGGAPPSAAALDLTIDHDSYATWEACVTKMTRYAAAGARKAHAAGKRASLLDVIARPPLRFLRQYVLQLGFLDGAHGWLLCALASTQVFLKYAALRELSRHPQGTNAAERPEGRGR
ncbi:MAG: glycosyltransferase family 2 protein [Candidatus Eisenbacteria bacterium]|uniref:Glycosyltransferase family 2 protein n=1 Tax=Eiseniibacteriota bacterium TaxID=2212470 RepID=A0A933SF84_UNCEI|nr:glycosyltransferase family 2 protein [Candidatus Eisenbacteria bacterium]